MYRVSMLALALLMVAGFAGQSLAADGNLPKSLLADIGLSGAQVMSDTQGQEIRGRFARAWGSSYAYVRGAGADNGYFARGRNAAGGFTISGAVNSKGHWAIAGGAARAFSR